MEFISALSVCGNVSQAAKDADLDRVMLYQEREKDEAFRAEWEKASAIGIAALEDEACRRAYDGWDEPVFHKGAECGTVRKFSDTLLIFLLKGHKPEKYREVQNQVNVSQPPIILDFSDICAEDKPNE